MDDRMRRYAEIEQRDHDDPMDTFREQMTVAYDSAVAQLIRLEREGKPGKLREAGFTAVADLLEQMTSAGRCGHLAPTIALLANSTQPTCGLTAGHAGWHRSEDGGEWGVPTRTTP